MVRSTSTQVVRNGIPVLSSTRTALDSWVESFYSHLLRQSLLPLPNSSLLLSLPPSSSPSLSFSHLSVLSLPSCRTVHSVLLFLNRGFLCPPSPLDRQGVVFTTVDLSGSHPIVSPPSIQHTFSSLLRLFSTPLSPLPWWPISQLCRLAQTVAVPATPFISTSSAFPFSQGSPLFFSPRRRTGRPTVPEATLHQHIVRRTLLSAHSFK